MESDKQQKPTLSLIQHLSCTGGTIICRCLASLPDVVLLSEVNPLSKIHLESPRFSPTDMTYLANIGGFPAVDELSRKIFRTEIKVILKHLKLFNKHLVIRDHSHSDYLTTNLLEGQGTTRKFLAADYNVKAVVTVRHPVDSYLSMQLRGWVKFSPPSFDEFCRRYLLFLKYNPTLSLFKYEDFARQPEATIQAISNVLNLKYTPNFIKHFNQHKLTGGSGRSSDEVIRLRQRRSYDEGFAQEVSQSTHYREICRSLNYPEALDAQP